ncbi:MAG: PIN domain-containing protein [Thermoflexales bacterium]|nr:PIN domain-containing protein [Thermoflexales bacterium]
MVRAFLDTSALLAGLASSQGAAHIILALAEANLLTLVVSDEVLVEAERNLAAKLPEALPYYQRWREACSLERVPPPPAEAVLRAAEIIHPKDAAILASAMEAGVDYLVTLDHRHFLEDPAVAQRSGLRIGTPGDFLAWFRALIEEQAGLVL